MDGQDRFFAFQDGMSETQMSVLLRSSLVRTGLASHARASHLRGAYGTELALTAPSTVSCNLFDVLQSCLRLLERARKGSLISGKEGLWLRCRVLQSHQLRRVPKQPHDTRATIPPGSTTTGRSQGRSSVTRRKR
jgi:hypothetical protein